MFGRGGYSGYPCTRPCGAGTDMGLAYLEFIDYVNSDATTNTGWFNTPPSDKIKQIPASFWKW